MEDDHSIDLKQHTLPKVSKWYLIRIIFYVVMLAIIALVWHFTSEKKKSLNAGDNIEEVTDVQIILPE